MLICSINIFNKNGKGLLDDMLSKKHFNWREMVLLMVLEKVPGSSHQFISKFLQSDKGNTTKLVTSLESRGYIYRKDSPEDKRYKHLYLTSKGKSVLLWLHKTMTQWEEHVYKGISEEEMVLYKSINDKMIKNLIGGNEGEY